MEQPRKVLILDVSDDMPDLLLEQCTNRFAFVKVSPVSGFLANLGASLPRIHVINCSKIDEAVLRLCLDLRGSLSGCKSYLVLCIPEIQLHDLHTVMSAQADDVLVKPYTATQLELRLMLADARMHHLARLEDERNFYRQAVLQEEQLSRKLLEQQQNLKGNLVNTVKKNQQLKTVHKTLKRQAAYDVLTGLLNRRSLNDRLELEVNRSQSKQQPLCGMMIDIDYFKAVNDSWGHQAGDMVLEVLGGILSKQLRKNDHAGRYGGEEFFIILPDTELDDCLMIANRIRITIENTDFEWEDGILSVTVSIGAARLEAGEALFSWVNHIDTALYRAKDSGRNRTCYIIDGGLVDYVSNPAATSAHK